MAKLGPAGRYADREMRAALEALGMTPPPGSVARYARAADRLEAFAGRGTRPLRAWQDKRRAKRERTGPSAEAQQEQRNADKVVDPTAVAKNATRMLPERVGSQTAS